MITILLTAQDEVSNLRELREHLGDALPVIVVDSGSTDGSLELAQATTGWRVVQHAYEGQAAQLNWALEHVVDTDWVFILDCDERLSAPPGELRRLVELADASGKIAVAFRRRNYFGKRWIRFGGLYPDWQVRLMRTHLRYEDRPVHGHVDVPEKSIYFADQELTHVSYTDPDHYIRKLAHFTVKEALPATAAASSRPRYRRLRTASHRLPFPGLTRFIYAYVIRQGFRDGRVGFYLALWAGFRGSVARGAQYLRAQDDLRVDRP